MSKYTIQNWLTDNRISQTELAEAFNVSRPTVHNWVHGKQEIGRDFGLRLMAVSNGQLKPSVLWAKGVPTKTEVNFIKRKLGL